MIDWAALGPLFGLPHGVRFWSAWTDSQRIGPENISNVVRDPATVKSRCRNHPATGRSAQSRSRLDFLRPEVEASRAQSSLDADGKRISAETLRTIWIGSGGNGSPPVVLPKLIDALGTIEPCDKGTVVGRSPTRDA